CSVGFVMGEGANLRTLVNHCRGRGTERCTVCNSSKFVRCEGCSGHGQILNFIQLTVTWKNHIYEFVADHNSDFPTELFEKLSPLVAFPVPSINQSSQFALQQHRTEFFFYRPGAQTEAQHPIAATHQGGVRVEGRTAIITLYTEKRTKCILRTILRSADAASSCDRDHLLMSPASRTRLLMGGTSDVTESVMMALTSSRCTLDFDDVDLSTPRSSPTDDVLVAPSMGSAADLSSPRAPQGGLVPALPLASLNPGTEQHHPLSPTVISGSWGTMGSSSNPPVDLTLGSAETSCPTHPDRRALLITEAAAKQAFQEYGNGKCCHERSLAEDMTTEELRPCNTYRYSLETFTESRISVWKTEQYSGQHVDAPDAGSVLQPWEIPVVVPDMFKDGSQTMKVPNTTCVKTCSHCKGMGRNTCLKCHGSGRVQCMWCSGTGRRLQMEMCQQCYGVGTESCRMCTISNIQTCVTCAGKGQVLTYLQLSITCLLGWEHSPLPVEEENLSGVNGPAPEGKIINISFISDHHSEFSADLFQAVHGERIHTVEQLSATPLSDFPDSSIIWASQNALEQHRLQFSSSCRVLRQRQSVELIPLTKVQYVWKGKKLSYFIYGMENKVFAQNYPQKCCCAVM
ncbi:unnamed protein product, partial [Ranitomeya imitator]